MEEDRRRLLEVAFDRKTRVHEIPASPQTPAKWRQPIFDPAQVGIGPGSLALVVQELGLLPIAVRVADDRQTARQYWELQEMLGRLAAALLNVVDDRRESADLPPIPDCNALLRELDDWRQVGREYQLNERRRDPDAPETAPANPIDQFSMEWREAERPVSRWFERVAVGLGAAAFETLTEAPDRGTPADRSWLVPLEQVIDLLSWLEPRATAPQHG